MRSPVLTQAVWYHYAKPGTDRAYAATTPGYREPAYTGHEPYAADGYGHASTDPAYALLRCTDAVYAPTPCVVLTSRTLLPGMMGMGGMGMVPGMCRCQPTRVLCDV
eukprot:619273-Rhodomonas_salina.1